MEFESNTVEICLDDYAIPEGSNKSPLFVEDAKRFYIPIKKKKKLDIFSDLFTHLIEYTTILFVVIAVVESGLGY